MSMKILTRRALQASPVTPPYVCWRCRMSAPAVDGTIRDLHTLSRRGSPSRSALQAEPRSQRRSFITAPPRRAAQEANQKEDINASALPSNPQTHYEYFPSTLPSGPPPAGPFTLDLRALRREFLQLQARAHPDLHPPELKHKAEALSSRINDAYKTLQDPLRRAVYILSLNGVDVESEAERESLGDAQGDQELLMVVLEARELIEEAQEEQELEGLKQENDERIAESVEVLEKGMAESDWMGCKAECARLRYWMNIKQSIEEWEPGKPVMLQH